MPAKKETRSLKVCISLYPDICKKIKAVQTEYMKQNGKVYPFSTAITDILEEHFS